MKIIHGKDEFGDSFASIMHNGYCVWLGEDIPGIKWSLNFCLSEDFNSVVAGIEPLKKEVFFGEEMTGIGAFKTMRLIRPAVEALLNYAEEKGIDWDITCEARRAKLYSRYLPSDKIFVADFQRVE